MLRNGQTHFKILRCHPGIVGHFQNHAWKNLITMTNEVSNTPFWFQLHYCGYFQLAQGNIQKSSTT